MREGLPGGLRVAVAGVTIEIALQLAASALLMLVTTFVHGLGLVAIHKVLGLSQEHLEERDFDFGAIALMAAIAMGMFVLHTLEIWIFAVFYMAVGAIGSLEEALYYSASAYATLGRTIEAFPDEWRLLGSIEALIGFLMIGWSTAFIVRKVNQLRR